MTFYQEEPLIGNSTDRGGIVSELCSNCLQSVCCHLKGWCFKSLIDTDTASHMIVYINTNIIIHTLSRRTRQGEREPERVYTEILGLFPGWHIAEPVTLSSSRLSIVIWHWILPHSIHVDIKHQRVKCFIKWCYDLIKLGRNAWATFKENEARIRGANFARSLKTMVEGRQNVSTTRLSVHGWNVNVLDSSVLSGQIAGLQLCPRVRELHGTSVLPVHSIYKSLSS